MVGKTCPLVTFSRGCFSFPQGERSLLLFPASFSVYLSLSLFVTGTYVCVCACTWLEGRTATGHVTRTRSVAFPAWNGLKWHDLAFGLWDSGDSSSWKIITHWREGNTGELIVFKTNAFRFCLHSDANFQTTVDNQVTTVKFCNVVWLVFRLKLHSANCTVTNSKL